MPAVKDEFYCDETDSTIKVGDFDINGKYNIFDMTSEISYVITPVSAFNMSMTFFWTSWAYLAVREEEKRLVVIVRADSRPSERA